MTEATLDPKGLEAAAKMVWQRGFVTIEQAREDAENAVRAYLAAIENPAPVEEDPE